MRLKKVTGKPFHTHCLGGHEVQAGDGYGVYADLDGQPFAAYYCTAHLPRDGDLVMYALTYVGSQGRTLAFANQGRNHYQTRDEAEQALKVFRGANGLPKVLTAEQVKTLEVREVLCYHHGDAKGIWFDNEFSQHEHKWEKA